jgi:hypothetical protein
MPKFFKKTTIAKVPTEDSGEKRSIKSYFFGFLFATSLLILAGIVVFKLGGFVNTINKNWQEIKFAYEKPSIVKSIRQNYQEQEKKLDQSFLKTQKSSEDQLIDEVVKKLQSADSLK